MRSRFTCFRVLSGKFDQLTSHRKSVFRILEGIPCHLGTAAMSGLNIGLTVEFTGRASAACTGPVE